eukprot:TRINITY_DN2907_c0_g1_i1.p1 TRINITY_DN2907_c0_g1~~TRINITY_DN2907_c0_g1_i1.p1  ORF type:complete len:280 (-),score=101.04 TRINITY_DN2907_c0_g1_i1:107-892(-)
MSRQLLWGVAFFCLFSLIASQGEVTRIRLVHTIPGSVNVDFFVNDLPTSIKNLAFTQASSYVSFPAGIWELKITLTGNKDQILRAQNFELVSHTSYSLIIQRAGTNGLPSFNLKIDDNSPPKERFAHIRFVHVSPVSPTFPINVLANKRQVFTGYNYGQASAYQVFPAGLYNITYQINNPVKTTLTTVPDVRINSGTVYTLYALGLDNIIATLSVDAVPRIIDACEKCTCANDNAFSSSTKLSFEFNGLVPKQTACCKNSN